MKTNCLQRCLKSVVFWALFTVMCPKRTIQSESIENHEKSVLVSKRLSSIPEPGFDLTKEEINKFKIWPEGMIPYLIDEYSFDLNMRKKLRMLLESFNDVTGLRFMELVRPPQDDDQRWVFILNRQGQLACEDYTTKNFTNSRVQKVVLGYDCLNGGSGGALATLVLALAGVPPQHNAPDRDLYIEVQMDNIIPEKRHLFEALKNDEWLFHDMAYDYLSAGHYDFHKYSANGKATILSKEELPKAITIGEEDGLSPRDILKIKMLYNFISLNRKKAKASDCSLLFKPGNSFNDIKSSTKERIKPRDKPKKYLGILEDNNNADENIVNEEIDRLTDYGSDAQLPNDKRQKLHSKTLKHINKDKLGDLSDFDTDFDQKRKRQNKGRQMLKGKDFDMKNLKSKSNVGYDKHKISHQHRDKHWSWR